MVGSSGKQRDHVDPARPAPEVGRSCSRLRGLLSVGLLSRSELPGLVTWHRDIAPDRDDPVFMYGELNLVALADVQCLPDRIRQGELRLLAKPRSSVGPRL